MLAFQSRYAWKSLTHSVTKKKPFKYCHIPFKSNLGRINFVVLMKKEGYKMLIVNGSWERILQVQGNSTYTDLWIFTFASN